MNRVGEAFQQGLVLLQDGEDLLEHVTDLGQEIAVGLVHVHHASTCSMIACVDAEPEHVAPDVVDRHLAGDDALDRRLGYVLTALNIAGAVLVLVYMVQVLDETSGGALKRRWETWREAQKHKVRTRAEYDMSVRRLQFEAWSAIQGNEGTDE